MSTETAITKDNLNEYLKELAKEFRRLNGKTMPAEIILIGGAAVLANYGFRDITYDIDAVISASSAMKEAANRVGDKLGLQNGWLNMDFRKTKSFSDKLAQVSVYYKTYSNILTIRTVTAEYLIAMKLVSGRQYKYDLSDIAGILLEQEKSGNPISREDIYQAVIELYGGWGIVPENSAKYFNDTLSSGDYAKIYQEIRASEKEARELLLEFDETYPGALTEDNLADVLEKARRKQG